MAMSKESMSARIVAKIESRNTNLNEENKAILMPFISDICEGIIEEITEKIEITVQVSNVQPGSGTATGTNQVVS